MRAMTVLVVLWCTAGWAAGKKTVVVGAGDCADGALLSASKDFQTAAKSQKGELVDPETALRLVRPQPVRALKDIGTQIEAARQQFYEGKNDGALELVQDALIDLERTAPLSKLWSLTETALVVQAQIFKGLDRPKDSAEAFRKVLRVNPTFKLDPDAYPPSTIQAMEAVRKELTRAKKGLLQVSSTPPGASVFVDGREVGKTPFKLELPQGSYKVALVVGDAVSFPHRVTLAREQALQVNLAFEGAVAQQAPLCVRGEGEDTLALNLASTLGADQVVVLRNISPKGAPAYLSGTLYEVARGERVRNAGVRADQLKDLMLYLFTGKPEIVSSPPPLPPPPMPPPAEEPAPDPRPRAEAPPAPGISTARLLSYVALGAGAASAAVGVIVYTGGAADRTTLASLKGPDGKLPDPIGAPGPNTQARALLGSVTSNQALSFTLIGVGAGALVGGAMGMLFFPAYSANVSIVPTREGGAVSFSGTF